MVLVVQMLMLLLVKLKVMVHPDKCLQRMLRKDIN